MPAKTQKGPVEPLEEAGPLLYGLEWRIPLANALGVTPRTLDHWRAHKTSPSPDMLLSLRAVYRSRVREKQREMEREMEQLRRLFGDDAPDEGD